jgi:hypothetical protein
MSYLQAVPTQTELEASGWYAVVAGDSNEVVYVEESASKDAITAALEAWGLRVRAEREAAPAPESARPIPSDSSWETTRPAFRSPGRLLNDLSPVYSPIFFEVEQRTFDPVQAWSWFGVAA